MNATEYNKHTVDQMKSSSKMNNWTYNIALNLNQMCGIDILWYTGTESIKQNLW